MDSRPYRAPSIWLLALLIALSSITLYGIISSDAATAGPDLEFEYLRLHNSNGMIKRGSIGDILPEREGLEIVTASSEGLIEVTYGRGYSWTTMVAAEVRNIGNPSELTEINFVMAVDILPEIKGDEVLSVDMDSNLRLTRFDGTKWRSEIIYRSSDWLYEIDHSDIDGDGQDEIVVVGEDRKAVLLERNGTKWDSLTIFTDDVHFLDTCHFADVLDTYPGDEVIVGGGTGKLYAIYMDGDMFGSMTIADLGWSITDVTSTDMDPDLAGIEVYASNSLGGLFMVHRGPDGIWTRSLVHNEGKNIYGIESGELEPGFNVIVTASWAQRVGILYHDSGYIFEPIYQEEWMILGCAIGDIDPSHKHNEVLSFSQLKRLTMIYRDDPGVVIDGPFDSTSVYPGEKVELPFNVRSVGGYKGDYTIEAIGLEGSIFPRTSSGDSNPVLSFVSPNKEGYYETIVSVHFSGGHSQAAITVIVRSGSDNVSFDPILHRGSIAKDRQAQFKISAFSQEGLASGLNLSIRGLPIGFKADLSRTSCDPCGVPDTVMCTVSVESFAKAGNHSFFLIGESSSIIRRAVSITINVVSQGLQDFFVIPSEDSAYVDVGAAHSIDLSVISVNGFGESVSVAIGDLPVGINANISATTVIPTSTVVLELICHQGDGPYMVPIYFTAGNIKRTVLIRIDPVEPKDPLSIEGPLDPIRVMKAEEELPFAMFEVRISPGDSPRERIQVSISSLPPGFNLTMDPAGIGKLPYPINVTFRIWGPGDSFPSNLTIVVTDLDDAVDRSYTVHFDNLPVGQNGDDKNHFVWILITILAAVMISGILVLILSRRVTIPFISLSSDRVEDAKAPGHHR